MSVLIVEQGTPKETLNSQDPLKPQTPVDCVEVSILPDVDTPPQHSSPFWVIESPQQPPPSNNKSQGKICVAQIAYSLTPKLQNTTPKQPQRFGPISDDSSQIATQSPSSSSMYFSKKLKCWIQVSKENLRKCDALEVGFRILSQPSKNHSPYLL